MKELGARVLPATLVLASMLGVAVELSEYDSRRILDRYRRTAAADYRSSGADPEASVQQRLSLLRAGLRNNSSATEVRTELALAMIDSANAHLLAGHTDAQGEEIVASRLAQALAESRAALTANPTDSRAWLSGYRVLESARLLGQQGLEEKSGDVAAGFLNGAVRTNPKSGALREALAGIMAAAGRRAEAAAQYRLAVQDPSVDGVAVAGEMLEAGMTPAEIAEMTPETFHDQYGVGQILLESGEPALAERAFLEAGRLSPSSSEPWVALSNLAEKQGRHAEALAYAQRGLTHLDQIPPPGRSDLLLCAALASRSLGDAAAALSYASRAVSENPANLFLYNFIGSILYDRRDYEGAIRNWRSLLEDHADDPYVRQYAGQFHRSLGYSYLGAGDREHAMKSFLDALGVDAKDPEAIRALERLTSGPSGPSAR